MCGPGRFPGRCEVVEAVVRAHAVCHTRPYHVLPRQASRRVSSVYARRCPCLPLPRRLRPASRLAQKRCLLSSMRIRHYGEVK